MDRYAVWKRTSLERIPRRIPLGYLRRNEPDAIRLSTTEKERPMGFRPWTRKQLHTAFANKNDDELRDSGTQALEGDLVGIIRGKEGIGFGTRVDTTLCSSPHTDI